MEPNLSLTNRSVRYGALGVGTLLAGALAYIGLSDPHRPGFLFPPCPFRVLTGWDCPACGGLRMTHDLLHGDLGAAVVDNVFLLVGLPLLAVWIGARWRLGKAVFPVTSVVVIVAAVVVWTVVRNVPGFPLIPTLSAG
jgi:hypothetical protein